MKLFFKIKYLRAYFLLAISFACSVISFAQQSWTKELQGIGTFSSPRVTDLNQDGIKDIVLGAGRL